MFYCWSKLIAQPEWHTDIIANPQTDVWLPDGRYAGVCVVVNTPEEKQEILKAGGLSRGITMCMASVD